ncbi:MAG TPA: phenylalanine--tRNA ligase beta subunit-related protein [Anaerolineales bacterium]|nr:phenylalanine--tRNA ligase beta subunit-related protein [Anaerolineales bacterium]
MSKFMVTPDLFKLFPQLCFGVVVAEGTNNQGADPQVAELEAARAQALFESLKGTDLKAHPHIAVWREAFQKLGQNPNKYPSSIEALARRVAKKPELPDINRAVNLVNAMSVTYLLPMGAHDLEILPGDIEVRLARPTDVFIPIGGTQPEALDEGEVVYATGDQIRTRKWVWRQSELAKVSPESTRLFFPIDAFYGVTDQAARAAQAELAELLGRYCGATTRTYWVDQEHPSADLDGVS